MQEVKNESDARLANREKKPTSDLSAANFSPVSIPLEVLDILKRPASIWSQEQRNAVLLFFFCDVQSLACLCAFTNKKLRKMGLACEETDIVIDHLFEKLQSTKTNINFDQAHDKAKESDLAKKFFAYLCGSIRNAVCNLARNREGHTVVLSIQMQGEPPVRGGIDPNLVDMQNQGNTPLHRQDPSHRLAVYQDHHAIKMMREEIQIDRNRQEDRPSLCRVI